MDVHDLEVLSVSIGKMGCGRMLMGSSQRHAAPILKPWAPAICKSYISKHFDPRQHAWGPPWLRLSHVQLHPHLGPIANPIHPS